MERRNVFKHFKLITIHRWYVFLNCCKAGMPIRGLCHDLSKYSPTEFWESVKYFQGNRSPIDACKEANGYSMAWMHHKGRNPHHYEHWQDNFDKGGQAVQMPFKYALELVCDYLAAGRAYMKKDFSYIAEYDWWCGKKKNPIAMHPQTKEFIELMLNQMRLDGNNDCLAKPVAKHIYKIAERNVIGTQCLNLKQKQ